MAITRELVDRSRLPAEPRQAAVVRLFNAWMLMVLGAMAAAVGACSLIRGWGTDRSSLQPHHDFAGPTDFSSLSRGDVVRISIGVIAFGCAFFALGWWLRGKKRQHRPALPEARAVRDD